MTKRILFHKLHGLGNDVVVINNLNQSLTPQDIPIVHLANRHLGIGFDQLLLIEKSAKADFACRIYNADGSAAAQCGNGMRCVARWIHEEKLSANKNLSIETPSGIVKIVIEDYKKISVSMGIPELNPIKVPFITNKKSPLYSINLTPDNSLQLSVVSIGNPHAILKVSDLDHYNVREVGQKISSHPAFPERVNVGFMEINDRSNIRLRTFERGVGETYACGTNACAAVVAGIINHWLDREVTVHLNYGNLQIAWQSDDDPVSMMGPAVSIFSGWFEV